MSDMINSPPHYNSINAPECIMYTRYMHFSIGNAFKYVYRNGSKSGTSKLEDFKKARYYIEDYISHKPYAEQKYCPGALLLCNHDNGKILRLIVYANNCTLQYMDEHIEKALLEINKVIVSLERENV